MQAAIDARPCAVCAFDFDLTLRVEKGGRQDVVAPDAKRILDDCLARRYGIAIASANGERHKIVPLLRRTHPVFNDEFFGSLAFQIGEKNKTKEMEAIVAHYQTTPSCVVVYDDT